jgi:hypothetical protein
MLYKVFKSEENDMLESIPYLAEINKIEPDFIFYFSSKRRFDGR